MKAKLILVVRYFLVLLFVYASMSKLITFEEFKVQLTQSPLLSAYAIVIAYIVIIVELIIAGLLTLRKTTLIGLYLSYGLMVAFTFYIYIILNHSDFVPCSCGGVLEKLGWTEHLWFNIIVSLLTLIAIYFQEQKSNKKRFIVSSILLTVLSTATVLLLFLSSEHIIKKENPFLRRYLPHGVAQQDTLDLQVNTFYFAGYYKDKVYLGNSKSPLVFISVDSLLKREDYTINIDSAHFQYRYLKLKTLYPDFFLADGSIPIVYKGKLDNSNPIKSTEVFSYKQAYFTDYIPVNPQTIIIKSQSSKDYRHILAVSSNDNTQSITINDSLLESDSDGVFDTDGILSFSEQTSNFIYAYYYKNKYVITKDNLELIAKQNTIDTTKTAMITSAKLPSGQNKMTTPISAINRKVVVKNNLLFIVSNSLGQNESKAIWKQASIVDIYDFKKNNYVGSFYMNHLGDEKLMDLIVTDHYIYGLFDQKLVCYRLAKSLIDKFN